MAKCLPVTMDLDPAPQELLELIQCGYKTDCYNRKLLRFTVLSQFCGGLKQRTAILSRNSSLLCDVLAGIMTQSVPLHVESALMYNHSV